MGRILMYLAIAGLAVFVLMATFVLEHGGGYTTGDLRDVSIHDLRTTPETFRGQTVTVDGRLSFSQEHRLWQLVDEDLALIIRTYDREDVLVALSGRHVEATGKFNHNPEIGIYIDADIVREIK